MQPINNTLQEVQHNIGHHIIVHGMEAQSLE